MCLRPLGTCELGHRTKFQDPDRHLHVKTVESKSPDAQAPGALTSSRESFSSFTASNLNVMFTVFRQRRIWSGKIMRRGGIFSCSIDCICFTLWGGGSGFWGGWCATMWALLGGCCRSWWEGRELVVLPRRSVHAPGTSGRSLRSGGGICWRMSRIDHFTPFLYLSFLLMCEAGLGGALLRVYTRGRIHLHSKVYRLNITKVRKLPRTNDKQGTPPSI